MYKKIVNKNDKYFLPGNALNFSDKLLSKYKRVYKVMRFSKLIYLKNFIPEFNGKNINTIKRNEINNNIYSYLFHLDFDHLLGDNYITKLINILKNDKSSTAAKEVYDHGNISKTIEKNKPEITNISHKNNISFEIIIKKLNRNIMNNRSSYYYSSITSNQTIDHSTTVNNVSENINLKVEKRVRDIFIRNNSSNNRVINKNLKGSILKNNSPMEMTMLKYLENSNKNEKKNEDGINQLEIQKYENQMRSTANDKHIIELIQTKEFSEKLISNTEIKSSVNEIVNQAINNKKDEIYDSVLNKSNLDKYRRGLI